MSRTPKKDSLKIISEDLRKIDFDNFNPKDKISLISKLEKINSQLNKLLRGFENETS